MGLREIAEADIHVLFEIRPATHENRLTREELTSLGITEKTVQEKLDSTYKGWLYEIDKKPVGFATGDSATGELWVIAVLPEFIGRGIGSKLLHQVEQWLKYQGWSRFWLTTDIDTRLTAYGFYLHHGWIDDRIENGMRYMIKQVSKQKP